MKKTISMMLLSLLITGLLFSTAIADNKEEVQEETKVVYFRTIEYLTDEDFAKLFICKQDVLVKDENIVELSQQDAYLLMQVARCEGGAGLAGQLWTMRTILNRLDAGWADTLWDVLTMDNQFEVVTDGSYKNADLNSESHLALAIIESGWNESQGALYWEANTNSNESWHKKNLQFIAEIEGNLFYK